MKQESREALKKYGICFGVEIVIAFLVVWSNGFFTESAAVNIQIIADDGRTDIYWTGYNSGRTRRILSKNSAYSGKIGRRST